MNLKQFRLEMVVFFGGAIVMILEIVGSRAISPYFGNSLVVWTNLIGVVLGCLSAGYYFGGKVADKEPTYARLERLIFGGALFLVVTAFFKEPILSSLQFSFAGDLRAASFVAILALFGPVSFLLGMVSPLAAKLKLSDLKGSGKVVGNLYALSTFGSISGTFAAGFVLIPGFGVSALLFYLAFALLMLASIADWRLRMKHVLGGSIIIMLFLINRSGGLRLDTLADIDSLYNRIIVREIMDQNYRKVVIMSIDNAGVQSAIVPDSPDELYLDYAKAYSNYNVLPDSVKKVLIVGGGGYTIPRDILSRYPNTSVDVVEIDKEMTELARKYFFLKDSERLSIFHEDARAFVRLTENKYDAIFLDAFNALTPPPHLTTKEFMTDLSERLTSDGVLVINMIGALSGVKSHFLSAELATLNHVFPQISIYPAQDQKVEEIQNLLVVARKKEDEAVQGGISVRPGRLSRLLTDDWSPVEFLTKSYYQ